MGSPKPLLKVGGITFIQNILSSYATAGISQHIVLGKHSTEITSTIDLSSGKVLVNPDPSRGPLSSLLIALEQASTSDAFILHPVDHPLVSRKTIQSLVSGFERVPHCILIPEFRGRRGHPVLIPSKYYPELRQAPLSEGARWVVRANRASNHLVSVNDPGILLYCFRFSC